MSILFTNVTAATMDASAPLLAGGFVAVDGTKITYVGAQRPESEFERVIDCAGKVMMPGFVNTHTHIPMTLLSNMAAGILDQPLSEQEVLDAAAAAKEKFSGLVRACLKKM